MRFQSMTLREACKSALTILKQVMEEKLNATNVEVRHQLLHDEKGAKSSWWVVKEMGFISLTTHPPCYPYFSNKK